MMRALVPPLLSLLVGCAFGAGPIGFAFGQASICRGPATTVYSATGELLSETCEGGYVAGGPVSDSAGRAIGVVGQGVVRTGQALGGVP